MSSNLPNMQTNTIVLYKGNEGAATIEVLLKDETMWLTQKAMAELFNVNSQAITRHLSNIFSDNELDETSTCSIFEQVQKEGTHDLKRI